MGQENINENGPEARSSAAAGSPTIVGRTVVAQFNYRKKGWGDSEEFGTFDAALHWMETTVSTSIGMEWRIIERTTSEETLWSENDIAERRAQGGDKHE